MRDWWDYDSRHPANGRSAIFGSKLFLAVLDLDDDVRTYSGRVDYKIDELGLHIEGIEYYPSDEGVRDLVEEYVRGLF